MMKKIFRILSFFFYLMEIAIGSIHEMLFNASKHYLINKDARNKLSKDFNDIIKRERLKSIFQIAYEIQTSAFALLQIKKGNINIFNLRSLGVFYEYYQKGEELIGNCFRHNILPIPSTILVNRKFKKSRARNIDCGFVYGYLVPSIRASFAQWLVTYYITYSETVNDLKKPIQSKILKITTKILKRFFSNKFIKELVVEFLKSAFSYKFIKDTMRFINTNKVIIPAINEVEDTIIISSISSLKNHKKDTFIYKTRLTSYIVDDAQNQNELVSFIVNYANQIRQELGIMNEKSFTKFINCKEIVELARKKFPDVRMEDFDDSDRNLCKRINLKVQLHENMGRYLGGLSTSSKDERKVIVILNKNFHPYRLLFWLIHEICHYLLNHPGSFSINPIEFYKLRNSPEISRFEIQAYILTAELIIPHKRIKESIDDYQYGDFYAYEKISENYDLDPQQTGTILLREKRGDLVHKKDFAKYKYNYYKYYYDE